MVDTIRLKTKVDKSTYDLLLQNAINRNDKITINGVNVSSFRTLINLPSYYTDIALFVVPPDLLFIEFSVPKMLFKNNIQMITAKELQLCIVNLHEALCSTFQGFPPLSEFYLQRLDICYNWFTHSEIKVKEYLKALIKFSSKRKSRANYGDRGFEDKGSRTTIKFYDKYKEFLINDFKKLDKIDYEKAGKLLELSRGVLRFEVELRKKQLQIEFNNYDLNWLSLDISDEVLKSLLNKHLSSFIGKLSNIVMDKEKILEILTAKYGSNMATTLIGFYDNRNLKVYLKTLNRSTLSRYRKQLREAGIGIQSKYSLPKLEII